MTKIDKNDIENINFIKKELKLKTITKIKIQKDKYLLEISTEESVDSKKTSKLDKQNETSLHQVQEEKSKIKIENIVKSPMVGVAYLSPDPASPPYIKEGQHVKQGDIMLLIEAMKTFNEIKAPKSGVIQKINILNSQPVEFGDELVIFE